MTSCAVFPLFATTERSLPYRRPFPRIALRAERAQCSKPGRLYVDIAVRVAGLFSTGRDAAPDALEVIQMLDRVERLHRPWINVGEAKPIQPRTGQVGVVTQIGE